MVIDYKGVSFSFKDVRKSKRLKRFKLIIIFILAALLTVVAWNFVEAGKIKKIQTLLLEGKEQEASTRFKNLEATFFHKNTKKELKAILCLFSDDLPQAQKMLTLLGGKTTAVESRKFLEYFSNNAQYPKLEIYNRYLEKYDKSEDLLFYHALTATAFLHYQESTRIIARLSPAFKKTKENELSLINKINKELAVGKINYIFDVNGKPLAYYDLFQKRTISLIPGYNFDAFNGEFQKSITYYHLTLDMGIQEKLHRLFQDFKGTFILFNTADTSIAAAYSKKEPSWNGDANPVFTETYEPGSIIKILTMFAHLKSLKPSIFPFQCKGLWEMNNNLLFHDWTTHNQVNSYDESLALSCNLAFAKMGIDLGFDALKKVFNLFYFNSRNFTDLVIGFQTGTFKDKISSDFELANLSVGLNLISTTTFHAGLISQIISQNGSIYQPYLIKSKKNLLNISFYNHSSGPLKGSSDNVIFDKIKNAMIAVVEHPNGTGRRAKSDSLKIAMKTGTSGDKKGGLDSVLTGFFPAEKPRYTFAFRLEGAGKAELKGALFLKDFLSAIR
ncbi:MAG: penicillin-binding transpeptidase domain-containing protein [Candidatus Omnitrophota bacterium]